LRSYHREILAGAGQRSHAGGRDLDGVFDLDEALLHGYRIELDEVK